MNITDLLQRFGIVVDNKEQVNDFIQKNEEILKCFFVSKWTEHQENLKDERTNAVFPKNEDSSVEEIQITDVKKIENPIEDPEMKNTINDNESSSQDTMKENTKNATLDAQIKNKHISFPNGKVNQLYCAEFKIENFIPEIDEISFEGIDVIGLSYSSEEKQIKGIPIKAGEHKIKMKCKRKDWEEGKPIFEREVVLIINPDPRSLWNNIPTPKDVEYYKEDSANGFIKVGSKKTKGILGLGKKEKFRKDIVAASQRGRSHAHEGIARDDDFKMYFDEATEWYVVAVADGAGSAKFSRKGSEIACNTVIDICKEQIILRREDFEKNICSFSKDQSQEKRNEVGKILYDIVGVAAFKAYKNIEKEAQEKSNPLKDYSTTLLLSICKKFEFGWFVGAFWVGDGGIGIYTKEPAFLKILGEADGGEFAGQTRFLTMPEIMQNTEIYRRLRFEIVPDFTALILMTDGITDPKFETDANLNRIEKWHNLWEDLSTQVNLLDDNEATSEQLLKWLDFWSPGNHDDRTIAILY